MDKSDADRDVHETQMFGTNQQDRPPKTNSSGQPKLMMHQGVLYLTML